LRNIAPIYYTIAVVFTMRFYCSFKRRSL